MPTASGLQLPTRPPKPRTVGVTAVMDKGLPLGLLRDTLECYGGFLDVAKLGIGGAYVEPRLQEKVALYREHGVDVYFGGTLFEKFVYADRLDAYRRLMDEHDVRTVEVSEGSVRIPLDERCRLVSEFSKTYKVYAEVGTKDVDAQSPPHEWLEEIDRLIEAGASYVITEGRDSGTAGIFSRAGELRGDLVESIVEQAPVDRLVFEAPTEKAQMYFINRIGPDVNLGNVNPAGLLTLEAQRCGLRYETFHIMEGRR
jgi:phosphosulfolactate synthase